MLFVTRDQKLVAIVSMSHFLIHMNMLVFPAIVMPFARELGLTPAEVFPLSFFMYFLYGALALPSGYLADKWSKTALLRICMIGVGVSAVSAGFSTSSHSFAVSLALIGVFCGLQHPVGLGLIAKEIEAQGKAHGINGMFGSIGEAAGPMLAGITLLFLDWRWVYIITGVMGVLGFILSFALSFREREHHEIEKERGLGPSKNGYWVYFAILCVAMTLGGLTYRANLTALPVFFETRAASILNFIKDAAPAGSANASSGLAGMLVSTLFLFSMAGQYVGGRLADSMDLRKAYFITQAAALPFVIGMSFLTGWWLYFTSGLFLFLTLGMQPIENSLVARLIPRRWLSTGYGIKFTFTFGLGSAAVYQVAYVGKRAGLEWIYPALSAQVFLMALTALLLLAVSSREIPSIMNVEKDKEAKKLGGEADYMEA